LKAKVAITHLLPRAAVNIPLTTYSYQVPWTSRYKKTKHYLSSLGNVLCCGNTAIGGRL
jgi:hypothetical protein